MRKKLKAAAVAIALGTASYWLYREFKKSDRTVRDTARVAGKDLYNFSRQTSKRALSAFFAGLQDWRQKAPAVHHLKNPARAERGNGGKATSKTSALPLSSEARELSVTKERQKADF